MACIVCQSDLKDATSKAVCEESGEMVVVDRRNPLKYAVILNKGDEICDTCYKQLDFYRKVK